MSSPNDVDPHPAAETSAPEFARAVEAMTAGHFAAAREMLERLGAAEPQNAVVKRLLAEVAARSGALDEAEGLLRQALALDPDFADARVNLASVFHLQSRFAEALAELEAVDAPAQKRYGVAARRASALARLGRYDEAISEYRDALDRSPGDSQLTLSLGHLLKAVGDSAGAIACYRRAIELSPSYGAAWWSLANLKTYAFDDDDIAAMHRAVESATPSNALRTQFALGKAYEDRGDAAAAFVHYSAGNRTKAEQLPYRPDKIDAIVRSSRELFTPALMTARASAGCKAEGAIFIVGMPRSGSTLVEQILASHPLVEGLSELPYVADLASGIESASLRSGGQERAYPQALDGVAQEELERLGAIYLERVQAHRRTKRAFFIDKMPNNWLHVGLIWLMLPGARIIDVRRHPIACGLSNFKQHFAAGQEFANGQKQFGHYYRCYQDLMRHWDELRPGVVHRVIYERLVTDPDTEIRRLLDHLGLPFDPACLEPHAADRAVATPSSEQVRQPISAAAIEQWRCFEQWLGPLKSALGPTLRDWSD